MRSPGASPAEGQGVRPGAGVRSSQASLVPTPAGGARYMIAACVCKLCLRQCSFLATTAGPGATRDGAPYRLEGQAPAQPPREPAACRHARTGLTSLSAVTPPAKSFRVAGHKLQRRRKTAVAPSRRRTMAAQRLLDESCSARCATRRGRDESRPRGDEASVAASRLAAAMLDHAQVARRPAACPWLPQYLGCCLPGCVLQVEARGQHGSGAASAPREHSSTHARAAATRARSVMLPSHASMRRARELFLVHTL